MRQKDAEVVATVLGNELRTCSVLEVQGLITAIHAVEGHMEHVHPEFDPVAYNETVRRVYGGWDTDLTTGGRSWESPASL